LASCTIGKCPAKLTEHVRLAIYNDRCSWYIQAASSPASEAQPRNCLYPTTSTFSLFHIISKFLKATKTGAVAACEQSPVLGPVTCFSTKIVRMRGRFDYRTEIAICESKVDTVVELELVDYAEVQLDR
jgi:hypothetical protein